MVRIWSFLLACYRQFCGQPGIATGSPPLVLVRSAVEVRAASAAAWAGRLPSVRAGGQLLIALRQPSPLTRSRRSAAFEPATLHVRVEPGASTCPAGAACTPGTSRYWRSPGPDAAVR